MKNGRFRTALRITGLLFILLNAVAYFHAYKFTHFSTDLVEKTKPPERLSLLGKVKTLLTGVNNPRPVDLRTPTQPFENIYIQSNKRIECWHIKTEHPKGTVVLFHGYSGSKSSLLDKSDEFIKLGFNTFLVDFMGSGGSEGNQTTLGFTEATEVKSVYDFLNKKENKPIFLFGTSMGSVAIMKSIADYQLQPDGIMLECPFGTMYQTTCARFRLMNAPVFPMAGLLVLWGGVQNNFWAFGHNPIDYAKNISCPTLLLYGENDKNVSRQEIDDIFTNLKGEKTLKTFPLAGHDNYLINYKDAWINDVRSFIEK